MITPDLTAFVAKMHLDFPDEVAARDLERMIRAFMSEVSLDCVKAGVKLIGHIKCVAETPGQGYLACSVTGHDGRVNSKGTLESSKSLDVVLNVILYGLEMDKVERIVEMEAEAMLSVDGTRITIEPIELEEDRHDHSHEHHHGGHDHPHEH